MNLEKILAIARSIFAMVIPQLKNPASTAGVKELKEAILGANEITIFLFEHLQDGFQVEDVLALMNKLVSDKDPEFLETIKRAVDGYEHIPAEIKDIDLGEALEIVDAQLSLIPRYLNAIPKKPAVEA